MDKPYLFAGFVILSIVVLSLLIYSICYMVDKICEKLVKKQELKLYEELAHPHRIVPLESDEFNEFAELATKYGEILSFERINERTDKIIRYLNVERLEMPQKK